MTLSLILLACFLVCNTCGKDGDKHDSIVFVNNSNNDIYVCGDDWSYPDTAINFANPSLGGDSYRVAAKTSGDPLRLRDTYEGRFGQIDKIMFFVFDAQVLENTPWDTVKAKYKVLERYDLSLEDLERLNWTITYPKDSIK